MSTPGDLLELERTEIEQGYETDNVVCMDCDNEAAYIGTGHLNFDCPTIEPPPPWFKCVACYEVWRERVLQTLAFYDAMQCAHCHRIFDMIDTFSYWRPV